ncbi:Uncharacterized protein dnm_072270 [Desulfonema magnum]|uniref:Uncharacterized protein n=1 Tax=Desulfonema magnum TaxID=45655 RepID=A0A975BT69_9BACT|nr:Uncharacterized protein dnm_072270 [Desulfonema magnum]
MRDQVYNFTSDPVKYFRRDFKPGPAKGQTRNASSDCAGRVSKVQKMKPDTSLNAVCPPCMA